jgi:hypothetical protein
LSGLFLRNHNKDDINMLRARVPANFRRIYTDL